MKKILFLLAISALAVTISCNKDDEENIPNPEVSSDEITYGSNAASIQTGLFLEVGNYDVLQAAYEDEEESTFESASHFGNLFTLSDGQYDSATGTFNNETISIRTELFSSGGGVFRRGSFDYFEEIELNGEPTVALGKNYFTSLQVIFEGETNTATAGTIAIAGTAPDYTISFDITLGVSTTLKGAFSGSMIELIDE